MKDTRQKTEPLVLPAPAGTGRFASACRLIFLIFALCVPMAAHAADPYAAVLENYFAARPEVTNDDTPGLNLKAAEPKASRLDTALKIKTQKMAQGAAKVSLPPADRDHNGLLLGIASLLGAALLLRRFAPQISKAVERSVAR